MSDNDVELAAKQITNEALAAPVKYDHEDREDVEATTARGKSEKDVRRKTRAAILKTSSQFTAENTKNEGGSVNDIDPEIRNLTDGLRISNENLDTVDTGSTIVNDATVPCIVTLRHHKRNHRRTGTPFVKLIRHASAVALLPQNTTLIELVSILCFEAERKLGIDLYLKRIRTKVELLAGKHRITIDNDESCNACLALLLARHDAGLDFIFTSPPDKYEDVVSLSTWRWRREEMCVVQ